MCQPQWSLPETSLLAVQDTTTVGRAVFAKSDILAGTPLLLTSHALSPLSHVILRPYRKEVCAQCFLYDRGHEWKIKNAALAVAFCSANCESAWQEQNDEACQKALLATETFIRSASKKQNKSQAKTNGFLDTDGTSPIDGDQISNEWQQMRVLGETVRRARVLNTPSKLHRAVLRNTQDLSPDPDILTYTLSGVLSVYRASIGRLESEDTIVNAADFLPSLYQLAADDRVFITTPVTTSPLEDYTSSYLVLLAILPTKLLQLVSTDLIINLASRASHNAFSIRPEGMTDGDQSGEFLGWGVWPEASFFNHSCRPNVIKERKGRTWTFSAGHDTESIANGAQLCITYLGGDEKDLDVHERRKRLQEQWGFWCVCDFCQKESNEKSSNNNIL